MKLLLEKMYYISYGKKIDRAVYCKKILDIVAVMNWYTLFRQHILDRGIEYYEDGNVVDFQCPNS